MIWRLKWLHAKNRRKKQSVETINCDFETRWNFSCFNWLRQYLSKFTSFAPHITVKAVTSYTREHSLIHSIHKRIGKKGFLLIYDTPFVRKKNRRLVEINTQITPNESISQAAFTQSHNQNDVNRFLTYHLNI